MGDTLAGTFIPFSMNHNRSVYKRVEPHSPDVVLLYYWDDRDGEAQSGWWFGPEVGGEEVWVHNSKSDGSSMPPENDWNILISDTVDPDFKVLPAGPSGPTPRGSAGKSEGSSTPSSAPSHPAPPAPPHRPPTPAPSSAAGRIGVAAAPSRQPPTGAMPQATGLVPARPGSERGDDNARSQQLRDWLMQLDDGAGAMLTYETILAAEFDADLQQIAAAKVDGGDKRGILGAVDPSFWETVKVQRTGHKMLFARGIARL